MTRQLELPQADAIDQPDTRTTTVTATSRLARELRADYDRARMAEGQSAWPDPDILPLGVWLERLWRDWLYSSQHPRAIQLLGAAQERAIWEDIIRESVEASELLDVGATAEAAMDAWNMASAWRLPLDAPEWSGSNDSEAFRGWVARLLRRSEEHGWLSGALLSEFISERVDNGSITPVDTIVIAGFVELTPADERLFGSLRQAGTQIVERIEQTSSPAVSRVAPIDQEAEIRIAARWARRHVEEAGSSDTRVAIVVPDLGRYRRPIERIFAEEFHPTHALEPDHDSERAFNISLGPPLAHYPIIAAALEILGADPEDVGIESAGRLFRSPYIAGALKERTRRGLLDAAVRRIREPRLDVDTILRIGSRKSGKATCPVLITNLARWSKVWAELPTRQAPSDWATSYSQLLEAVGWPGDRTLNSAEYQTMSVWKDLLSELAGLDGVVGRLAMAGAIGVLRRLALGRQFQPESVRAPVQILGMFEASGLAFDHLWIMGMHDGAWPRSSGPDPFLPLGLQRDLGLPRSSPGRELEVAKRITGRLVASASHVVVSRPQREGDADLRPSPLFTGVPEGDAELPGISQTLPYSETLRQSSRIETVEDHDAPIWEGSLARGGTAIFADQAACPFRAFAHIRLGARALDVPEPGLSALDRGILVHSVLERVWAQLGSHDALMSAGADEETLIRASVRAEIVELASKRRALRQPRFAGIEQARLERLVTDWLEHEKARHPFTVSHLEEERRVCVGGIDISIRADRVDRLDDGTVVVTDYKSSERSPWDWDGDRLAEPQLPLYATTTEETVSGVFFGILETGNTGYRGLAAREGIVAGLKSNRRDPPLAPAIDDWRQVLDRLGSDFRQGRARVDPKKRGETCRFCSLGSLCRIEDSGTTVADGEDRDD